jgi:ketosteroid isomerase-like protein
MKTDREYIQEAREASNLAIISQNAEGVASHYMDDIIVISGEGGKHVEKKNLTKIWKQMFAQKVTLFERLPTEIVVGDTASLAWETGVWKYKDGKKGGSYAAMWCKLGNTWKTRSELFVSLD